MYSTHLPPESKKSKHRGVKRAHSTNVARGKKFCQAVKIATSEDTTHDEQDTDSCTITHTHNIPQSTTDHWPNYRYYQINKEWQQHTCEQLDHLQFVGSFQCSQGQPTMVLTQPDLNCIHQIIGDGNCLFRAISLVTTGSQVQYHEMRCAILQHMQSIEHLLLGMGPDGQRNYASGMIAEHTIDDYIQASCMNHNTTWGTAIEIATAAHLLKMPIYVYDTSHTINRWIKYLPWDIDRQVCKKC